MALHHCVKWPMMPKPPSDFKIHQPHEGKSKDFPCLDMKLRRGTECWSFILILTSGTHRTAGLSATRAGPILIPRKFLPV